MKICSPAGIVRQSNMAVCCNDDPVLAAQSERLADSKYSLRQIMLIAECLESRSWEKLNGCEGRGPESLRETGKR